MARGAILLVDDDPTTLAVYRAVLQDLLPGAEVVPASSGQEALDLLQQRPFLLVLSDYAMEGMDGVELLERVRVAQPDALRVLLTGHAEVGLAQQALARARIDAFVPKPGETRELRGAIARLLERG